VRQKPSSTVFFLFGAGAGRTTGLPRAGPDCTAVACCKAPAFGSESAAKTGMPGSDAALPDGVGGVTALGRAGGDVATVEATVAGRAA